MRSLILKAQAKPCPLSAAFCDHEEPEILSIIVTLTGSTVSLGTHILQDRIRSPDVARVSRASPAIPREDGAETKYGECVVNVVRDSAGRRYLGVV